MNALIQELINNNQEKLAKRLTEEENYTEQGPKEILHIAITRHLLYKLFKSLLSEEDNRRLNIIDKYSRKIERKVYSIKGASNSDEYAINMKIAKNPKYKALLHQLLQLLFEKDNILSGDYQLYDDSTSALADNLAHYIKYGYVKEDKKTK